MKVAKNKKHKNQTKIDDHLVIQPKITNKQVEKIKQIKKLQTLRQSSSRLQQQQQRLMQELFALENCIKNFTIKPQSAISATKIIEADYIIYGHKLEVEKEQALIDVILGRHSQVVTERVQEQENFQSELLRKVNKYNQLGKIRMQSNDQDYQIPVDFLQDSQGSKSTVKRSQQEELAWCKYRHFPNKYLKGYQMKILSALASIEDTSASW